MMIVGGALFQADKLEEHLHDQVSGPSQIIGMRHVLVHGYKHVMDAKTWDVIENHLALLIQELGEILGANPP